MNVPEPSTLLTGGCLCGRVRYRITLPPTEIVHCHCTICRRAGGAPFVTWATFARSAFAYAGDPPAERASTPSAVRTFCASCGTPLTFHEIARPSWIDVTVGSLDRPEDMVPGHHIFTSSRLPWLRIDDGLPEYAASNPSERQG